MGIVISKLLVFLIGEKFLNFTYLLPGRWNAERKGIEEGELRVVAPPLAIRVVFVVEIMLGIAAFVYLLVQSLQQTYIQSEVDIQLKPAPYSCTVLSPLNTMFGAYYI